MSSKSNVQAKMDLVFRIKSVNSLSKTIDGNTNKNQIAVENITSEIVLFVVDTSYHRVTHIAFALNKIIHNK